jgi:homospermidine synthase
MVKDIVERLKKPLQDVPEGIGQVVGKITGKGQDKPISHPDEAPSPNVSEEAVNLVDNGQVGEEEPQPPAEPAPIAAKTLPWDNKIVFFGFGSVAECVLPILVRHLEVDFTNIIILDALDKSKVLEKWIEEGVTFIQRRVVEDNFTKTMEEFLSEGDLLIDLAYDIDCRELLQYCRDHGILYVNTSVEEWDYTEGFDERSPYDKSLYARQQELDEEINSWPDNKGTTAVIDHGANPGLISHFMKQGLIDLAKKRGVSIESTKENDYATLAQKLGVKVVLDTERDTQISNTPRQPGEFLNTWSVLGFVEEGTSPAELGWGTHEKEMPENSTVPDVGPKNQIFLSRMGMDTKVKVFVPHNKDDTIEITQKDVDKNNEATGNRAEMISTTEEGDQIVGVLIRHGESYSISRFLTTKDNKYRPTSYYGYCMADCAIASMNELRGNDYRPLPRQRIIYDNEIVGGADTLGCLIGGYDKKHIWWCGTSLNIRDAKRLVPLQNSTTIQVSISLVAAVMWAIENPQNGFCRVEDLPHDYILNICKPYLGQFISKEFTWNPGLHATNWFNERKDKEIDKANLWGFQNFLVRE